MAFDWAPTLEGALLRLRPGTAADLGPLAAAAADPLIWAAHPINDRWRADRFRDHYESKLANGTPLIIEDRATGAIIGMSRYSTEGTVDGEVEIGSTFLVRRCWGGAWNGELKRLMLDHAFGFVSRAIFLIGENNLRSRRAIEKVGCMLTDRLYPVDLDGRRIVHVIYAIDRTRPTASL